MRSLDGKLLRHLGYDSPRSNKRSCKWDFIPDSDEPCEACGRAPSARAWLVSYRELKQLGMPDEWTRDDRFHARLCRSCFLLWRGYQTMWTREYAREHGMGYRDAKDRREGLYLELLESLGDKILTLERAKVDYEQRIEKVAIVIGERMPYVDSDRIVSAIDLGKLKEEKVIIISTITIKE